MKAQRLGARKLSKLELWALITIITQRVRTLDLENITARILGLENTPPPALQLELWALKNY
jgi:hypothetical protein